MSTSEEQKSKLLKYTIAALSILTAVAVVPWGYTPVLLVLISVTVAVAIEYALSLVSKKKFPRSILSAVVFGQIVALSYSLANTNVWTFGYYLTPAYEPEVIPQTAPMAYAYVAIIAAVGEVVFRKLQGLLKLKYVNAAAAAKLLVFLPFLQNVLLSQAHKDSLLLAGAVGYNYNPANPLLANAFGPLVAGCLGYFPTRPDTIHAQPADVFQILALLKYHGWVGGASALAVITVSLALFVLARKYIKWRVTAAYFAGIAVMSAVMFGIFGGDFLLRLGFEVFIGSSIFLSFFMLTDPATTPNKHAAQVIFGVGVAVLTVLIQTFMGFLGGSILALVIMNLTVPLLDRIRTGKTPPATT